MRLFVAIVATEAIAARARSAAMQAGCGAATGVPLRWVQPEQLHVTLVFSRRRGDAARATGVVDALAPVVSAAPFDRDARRRRRVSRTRGAPRGAVDGRRVEGDAQLQALAA